MRLLTAALLAAAVTVVLTGSSAADCVGPTITVRPTSGPAGTSLTIEGTGFGDNCYDTGPPPPGQGVLGNPLTGVEIAFVDAAGTRTVLAVVDADADYRFAVEATVPAGAVPGPASLQAGSPPVAFTVTGAEVVPATPTLTG